MNSDKLKQLSAALAQMVASVLGIASLFGYTIPQDKLNVLNASATQILGGILVVSALLPSLIRSFRDYFSEIKDAATGKTPPGGPQSGRVRVSLALLTGALALAACATIVAPKSVDQSLAYAEASSTVARQSLTNLLLQKQVTVGKARAFGDALDQVDAAVDLGRTFKASGDLTSAQAQLDLAKKLLTQLQAELTAAARTSGELK